MRTIGNPLRACNRIYYIMCKLLDRIKELKQKPRAEGKHLEQHLLSILDFCDLHAIYIIILDVVYLIVNNRKRDLFVKILLVSSFNIGWYFLKLNIFTGFCNVTSYFLIFQDLLWL